MTTVYNVFTEDEYTYDLPPKEALCQAYEYDRSHKKLPYKFPWEVKVEDYRIESTEYGYYLNPMWVKK